MQILNNNAGNEVVLGNYKLSLNNGVLYLGKGSKFFIISPSRLGLNDISTDAKVIKIDDKRAYFFDKVDKVFIISPKEEHGELRIEIKELKLPFILSNYFRCSSYNENFLLIDIKKKHYIMHVGDSIIGSNIDISDKAMPFIADDVGLVMDKKDLYVIRAGIRNVLPLSKALNVHALMINYERKRGATTLLISDGTYDVKIAIDDRGSIKYGERINIFFETKKE